MRSNLAVYIVLFVVVVGMLFTFSGTFMGPQHVGPDSSTQSWTSPEGTRISVGGPEKKAIMPKYDDLGVWLIAGLMTAAFLGSGHLLQWHKKRRNEKFRSYMEKQFKDAQR